MYREEDMLNEAIELGAKGYVLKESAATDILQGIRTVAAGQHYVSSALSGFLVKRASPPTAVGTVRGWPASRRRSAVFSS